MDALILARMQFAANITFHILFPTLSIALGWTLLFFRTRWLTTRDTAWLMAYRFWTKVFALSFALGVVSGIVMSFQFGTNWPGFMERVGNIAGPLLGFEVLTAFFLESTFLGVMLFGHGRVGEGVHLLATGLVAFGTTVSAFWILALNSWLHTPAGHGIGADGVFFVKSWFDVVFNPSLPYRLTHMLLASGLTVAFALAGVSAWQLLKGKANASTPKVLRFGLTLGAVLIPLQMVAGDQHGLNTLHHQPQKIAAMEAVWQTEKGAPLLLFALPDEATHSNRYAVGLPRMASLILKHDENAEVQGLDDFPGARPPVLPLFFGFRVMVGIAVLMLLSSWTGLWLLRLRGAPDALPRPLLRVLAAMSFSGWAATVAGWYVTEVGRQPFIVFGLVRVDEVASKVPGHLIATTLALYVAVYLLLVVAFVAVVKYMAEKPVDMNPPRLQLVPAGATT